MNNIDKILQYLQVVAKQPIDVDGKIYWKDVRRIQLSKTFFSVDKCDSCGCCDVPESNVYTQSEYDLIMNITEPEYHSYNSLLDMNQLERLREGLKKELHTINDVIVPIYVFKLEKQETYVPQKGKVIDRCTWMFPAGDPEGYHFYCHIHPVTSITCKMPHLRFLKNSNSDICRIGIYQFGRNWATKCPIEFKKPMNQDEWQLQKESRIKKLSQLDTVAKDLNIDTYLQDIIEYINDIQYWNHELYLERDIISTMHAKRLLF